MLESPRLFAFCAGASRHVTMTASAKVEPMNFSTGSVEHAPCRQPRRFQGQATEQRQEQLFITNSLAERH